jgi:hypothetical protein
MDVSGAWKIALFSTQMKSFKQHRVSISDYLLEGSAFGNVRLSYS